MPYARGLSLSRPGPPHGGGPHLWGHRHLRPQGPAHRSLLTPPFNSPPSGTAPTHLESPALCTSLLPRSSLLTGPVRADGHHEQLFPHPGRRVLRSGSLPFGSSTMPFGGRSCVPAPTTLMSVGASGGAGVPSTAFPSTSLGTAATQRSPSPTRCTLGRPRRQLIGGRPVLVTQHMTPSDREIEN